MSQSCQKAFTIAPTADTLTNYWDFDIVGDPVDGNNPFVDPHCWTFNSRTSVNQLWTDVVHGIPWTDTVPGKIGNACRLSGTTMMAILGSWNPITQPGFTMFGWFKITTPPGISLQPLSFYLNSLGGTRPALNYNAGTGMFEIMSGSTAAPPSSIANWNFLAYTYDNATGAEKAYFNGALLLSGNAGVFAGPTPASSFWTTANDGTMPSDEIGFALDQIYSPARILALYNGGAGVSWPAVNSI